MLSPEQCRKLDPALKDLTNDQIEAILCVLYGLGNLAMESLGEAKPGVSKYPLGVVPKLEGYGSVSVEP